MATKTPTPQGISRLLAKAGFERSAVLSQARLHHRYTAGFHVRGDGNAVYVGWRNKTPLVSRSALQAGRDKQTALEMVHQYAEALAALGWPAEVIHLNGPLARITAKTEA
jgi:hypothetical protein